MTDEQIDACRKNTDWPADCGHCPGRARCDELMRAETAAAPVAGAAGGGGRVITEAALETLGFNKIVWSRVVPEYWLPLLEPTGDQIRDMNCRLGVRFNEHMDESGPSVWLVVGSMCRLPHIKEIDQLLRLYELLAGHPAEDLPRVKSEWVRPAGGAEYEVKTDAKDTIES